MLHVVDDTDMTMKDWIDLPFIVFFRCVLSFIGVYYITSDRKQEESDEQLLLTNADLFPGMVNDCLFCGLGGFVNGHCEKYTSLGSLVKFLQQTLFWLPIRGGGGGGKQGYASWGPPIGLPLSIQSDLY